MDSRQFADQYLMVNSDKFSSDQLPQLKNKLEHLPEDRQSLVQMTPLKNPIITLIFAIFLGGLAVDRFYLGDIVLGILKVISVFFFIGCIWVIIDWFLTYKKAKKINFAKIMLIS